MFKIIEGLLHQAHTRTGGELSSVSLLFGRDEVTTCK